MHSDKNEQLLLLVADFQLTKSDYAFRKITKLMEGAINVITSRYYVPGGDRTDLKQEALVGLWKGCRDYRRTKSDNPYGFLTLCIERNVITCIKSGTRQKLIPLNTGVSLSTPFVHDKADIDRTLGDVIPDDNPGPDAILAQQQRLTVLREQMQSSLSDFECKVLEQFLEGKHYEEIAESLGRRTKSVDNAMQRLKRKISWNGDLRRLMEVA